MSQIARMRSGLREAAEDLQETRERLLGLLPDARREIPPEDEGDAEPHPLTEMTAVIECGVHDSLDPLIQDLFTASEYQAKGARSGQPLGEIDLARSDEATRATLYQLVERDNFSVPAGGDSWSPSYTAEAAGLQVFHLHGRWFATWLKLEEPAETPEARRCELLLLDRSDEHPGLLVYRAV